MNEAEAKRLVDTYSDMILRICFTYLKNTEDAQDICQNVFLKMLTSKKIFENKAYEKAWIIRVAINECKDILKSAHKQRNVSIHEMNEVFVSDDTVEGEVLEMVMALPENYRNVIYLYYYEGYSAAEIGDILGQSETAVMKSLSRGRKKIKEKFFCTEGVGEESNLKKTCFRVMERGSL